MESNTCRPRLDVLLYYNAVVSRSGPTHDVGPTHDGLSHLGLHMMDCHNSLEACMQLLGDGTGTPGKTRLGKLSPDVFTRCRLKYLHMDNNLYHSILCFYR